VTGSFSFLPEAASSCCIAPQATPDESGGISDVICAYCSDGPQQQYRRSQRAMRGAILDCPAKRRRSGFPSQRPKIEVLVASH
jgi:hypothetical protein